MTSLTGAARRFVPSPDSAWPYALAALVLGAIGGAWTATGVSATSTLVLAVGLVSAALVLWRYQVGAVLIVLTLPLDEFGRVLSSPVSITLFHLALVSTLVSWGLAVVRRDAQLRFSAVDWGIGTLILAALWSMPFSLSRSATVLATVRLVFLWAFTLLYANVLSSRKLTEWVTWTLLATGFATALLALAQKYVPGFNYGSVRVVSDQGDLTTRVGGFFYDPNYLAGFLSVALLVALALVVHSQSWRRTVLCLGAAGVIGLGVVATLSRTGLVGVAVGVLVLIVTAPRKRVLALGAAASALVLVAALSSPAAIVERVRSIGEVSTDQSNATRVYMVPATYQMARDNWVFGTGLGGFRYAYPEYRLVKAVARVVKPHEIPLALWAEAGVAGIIAQIVLIWGLVAVYWRRRPKGWSVTEAFALAGILSLGVQSLFQYYLYFEYLWLFIAFAIAANRIARQEEAG